MENSIPPIYKDLLQELLVLFYYNNGSDKINVQDAMARVNMMCELIAAHTIITHHPAASRLTNKL